MSEPQANQVFNLKTNKLYERCLAVGYNEQTGQFFLPQMPTHPKKSLELPSIRRVEPEELPRQYQSAYLQLLNGESSNALENPQQSQTMPRSKENPLVIAKTDFSKFRPVDAKATERSSDEASLATYNGQEPTLYLDAV